MHLQPGNRSVGLSAAEVAARFEREAVRDVIDLARYRCRYFSWGEGPPIVFLHHEIGTSEMFLPVIAMLSRSFRCVAYDFPAGACMKQSTLPDLAGDLREILDHLGLKQSYLFASSFGDAVALTALHAQPSRMPRAILHAATAWRRRSWRQRFGAWLLRRWPGRVGSFPGWRRRMRRRHGFTGGIDFLITFLAGAEQVEARAVGQRLRLLGTAALRPILPEIRQPILLIDGDRDPELNRSHSDLLLRELPSAGRALVEGAGHFALLSHPQLVAKVVQAFLTPPGPGSPCSMISESCNKGNCHEGHPDSPPCSGMLDGPDGRADSCRAACPNVLGEGHRG